MREHNIRGFRQLSVFDFLRPVLLAILLLVSSSAAVSANSKYAAIVVDANTGKVLFSRNSNALRYPASLTKMMTLYILFEEMERGRFTTKSHLQVSKYAAGRPPSKLGLRAGQTISVSTAIRALAVKSANDVASVVAEAVEGSEGAFAERMTRTAHALGMKRTTFKNPSGLPDSNQKTTARDMARLGQALQDRFPSYYKYFSTRTFSYGKRKYRNTNRLLGTIKGMDGIKTGYTRASGFNLVTSVRRDDRHIIAVVMGGKTGKSRNSHMKDLIGRHLKRAKRGKRTAPLLLASAPRTAIAPARMPRSRPTPVTPNPVRIVSAAALPDKTPVHPVPTIDPIAEQIKVASAMPELAYTAPAGKRSGPIDKVLQPKSMPFKVAIAAAGSPKPAVPAAKPKGEATPTPGKHGGWHVQIAAVPTAEGAAKLLQQVQLKAGPVLKSAEPLTQPVKTSGMTLYRVRFAGFSGKQEARAVCARLKRKSVDCLAVPN